jgi:hypothetical protein
MRIKSHRASVRQNSDMPAVSQGLVEFANHHRQPAAPGIEVVETPSYRIVLNPDLPIAGPNNVGWIRCGPHKASGLIAEVRSIVAPRHLPLMWTIDPETEPVDFADHLAKRGVYPEPHGPEVAVMVLPVDATVESPEVADLELRDALTDLDTFRRADAVNAEAFASRTMTDDPQLVASQERRRLNQLVSGNRRFILASIGGEPAGSAGMTLFPPIAAFINGGAVRQKFRGRGVYRAMVAARLAMAREARVSGLTVWGGHASAPILARLGFETVGWRRFYPDFSTA